LFAGWPNRSAWIHNSSSNAVSFLFEVDKTGNQTWEKLKTVSVSAGSSAHVEFTENETGEWIRVKTDSPTTATVSFNYYLGPKTGQYHLLPNFRDWRKFPVKAQLADCYTD
jgi:hypothetical protein